MMMQCVMLSNYPVARALCLDYDFDNVDGSLLWRRRRQWWCCVLCFLIIQLLAPSRLRGRSAQCADSGHLGRGSCEIPHVNTSVRSPLQIRRGKYNYKHMQAVTLTCLGVKWEAPLTAKIKKYGKYEGSFKRSSFLSKEVNLKEGVWMSDVKRGKV